eukprot:351651-Chlamydomonas_euryale.AAC.6
MDEHTCRSRCGMLRLHLSPAAAPRICPYRCGMPSWPGDTAAPSFPSHCAAGWRRAAGTPQARSLRCRPGVDGMGFPGSGCGFPWLRVWICGRWKRGSGGCSNGCWCGRIDGLPDKRCLNAMVQLRARHWLVAWLAGSLDLQACARGDVTGLVSGLPPDPATAAAVAERAALAAALRERAAAAGAAAQMPVLPEVDADEAALAAALKESLEEASGDASSDDDADDVLWAALGLCVGEATGADACGDEAAPRSAAMDQRDGVAASTAIAGAAHPAPDTVEGEDAGEAVAGSGGPWADAAAAPNDTSSGGAPAASGACAGGGGDLSAALNELLNAPSGGRSARSRRRR